MRTQWTRPVGSCKSLPVLRMALPVLMLDVLGACGGGGRWRWPGRAERTHPHCHRHAEQIWVANFGPVRGLVHAERGDHALEPSGRPAVPGASGDGGHRLRRLARRGSDAGRDHEAQADGCGAREHGAY